MGEKTPYEAWSGKKPHLGHLKVFGCLAHVKNTTPHPKKLDDRSQKMVYLGVEEGSKAHRLYDPVKKKVAVSRDVIFEESVKCEWSGFSPEELMEFQVDGEASEFSTNWETVEVERNDAEPLIELGEVQSANNMGTVNDRLELQGVQSGAEGNANNTQQGNPQYVVDQLNTELNDLSDEEPHNFKSLNEIYDNTEEIELAGSEEEEAMLDSYP